jgi:hypothetical protein
VSYCANTGKVDADAGMIVSNYCSGASQVETGRVEHGQKSNQWFGTSFGNFQPFWFYVDEFRLMPEKYKPAEKVKAYCTQCRRVQKPGDVFCAKCGTRY